MTRQGVVYSLLSKFEVKHDGVCFVKSGKGAGTDLFVHLMINRIFWLNL